MSPGGHGIAYTHCPVSDIQQWARLACHRGDYTVLTRLGEYREVAPQHSHLQPAGLPLDQLRWRLIGRPGGHSFIAVEEYDAYLWSLEGRLHVPGEVGARCCHGGDNAVHFGAEVKGRSSNRVLASRCRRSMALLLGRGLIPFLFWEPSKHNPADLPLSWYGVRARTGRAGTIADPRAVVPNNRCVTTAGAHLHLHPPLLWPAEGPRSAGLFGDPGFGVRTLRARALLGFASFGGPRPSE